MSSVLITVAVSSTFLVSFDKYAIADAMVRLCTDAALFKDMSNAANTYYTMYCTIDKMIDGVDDAIKYINK